jgi:hypothetical protein
MQRIEQPESQAYARGRNTERTTQITEHFAH